MTHFRPFRVFVMSVLAMAGTASAQMTAPPPDRIKPMEEIIPPTQARPAAQPQQPKLPDNIKEIAKPLPGRGKPAKPPPPPLPEMPYTGLVERNPDGTVKPLQEPAELAALRRNPMVDKGFITDNARFFKDRHTVWTRVVSENLDVMEDIEDRFIWRGDLSVREEMVKVVLRLRPINPPAAPDSIAADLQNQGKLTDEQFRFNKKIVKEYHDAWNQWAVKDIPTDNKAKRASAILAMVFTLNVDEPVLLYEAAQRESGRVFAEVLPKLGLSEFESKARTVIAAKWSANASNADKLAIYKDLVKGLNIDQRKQIIAAALNALTPQ